MLSRSIEHDVNKAIFKVKNESYLQFRRELNRKDTFKTLANRFNSLFPEADEVNLPAYIKAMAKLL